VLLKNSINSSRSLQKQQPLSKLPVQLLMVLLLLGAVQGQQVVQIPMMKLLSCC
jgi:hypothetical protein